MAHIPECSSRFNCANILLAGDIDGEQTVRLNKKFVVEIYSLYVDQERFHAFLRKFGPSLKRQTAAMYFRTASRAMEAWNTLKSIRFRKSLNSIHTKLLRKRKLVLAELEKESLFE